jgi:predicted negative regulator of RcsB-dependent stress response
MLIEFRSQFLSSFTAILTIMILLFNQPVRANDLKLAARFNSRLQEAYFDIQKLKIAQARDVIDSERVHDPKNPFIAYLDNYADLHILLISENKSDFNLFNEKVEKRLQIVGEINDATPYKKFLQAEMRMHWAFAKLKFGNEISGARDIIRSYKLLEENKKRFPNFLPNFKTLGLLHVMIGSVPENYNWALNFLGLSGNIKLGLNELQTVIKKDPLFKQESELIYLLIHAYILQFSDTHHQMLRELIACQPDNLLLHFFGTTVLIKEGKSQEASQYLNSAPTGKAYIPFPFLQYLKGEIMLQKGSYKQAEIHYQNFLVQYKGFNYLKDAHLKLFMCNWLQEKNKEAEEYIRKVPAIGSEIIDTDKLAQKFAKEYTSNSFIQERKPLYKARYASDGGYFEQALIFLAATSEETLKNIDSKSEFNYRKGRILQKQNHLDRAIPYYLRAIAISSKLTPGFAASSSLQMGYIYRQQNQREKAVFYFKKALSFKKYEYKNR